MLAGFGGLLRLLLSENLFQQFFFDFQPRTGIFSHLLCVLQEVLSHDLRILE